jgi:hypothetical protein
MLPFLWNSHRFQVIDVMPKRDMMAVAYYLRNIFTEIAARRKERGERKLVVHADNARPHPAKVTKAFCNGNLLQIALHPPCSSDLASSDFSCFFLGHLTNRLQGRQFGPANELLSGVREILDEISIDTLKLVF